MKFKITKEKFIEGLQQVQHVGEHPDDVAYPVERPASSQGREGGID